MRAHFRYLSFKSFPTVPRAQQSIEIWPFNLHSEVSGVHQDSLSQNGSCLGSVSAHSLTLPRTSLDSREYVMTPRFPLGPHPSNAFAFAPGLPSFWFSGFFPLDSHNLATPCLGRKPKARVATSPFGKEEFLEWHSWWRLPIKWMPNQQFGTTINGKCNLGQCKFCFTQCTNMWNLCWFQLKRSLHSRMLANVGTWK